MLRGPYAAEFIEAEMDEICNLYRMGMLKPTAMEDLLPDDVVLKTTWAYKLKMEAGVIKRFRSRWCARGDLESSSDLATFSAMASSSCIRMLFSLLGGGTFKGLDMFDVGNAFASAPTRRRVFVQQPPGYWDGSSTVFQLMRAFYGQRDAGRLFWLHLEDVLFKHGWIRSTADPCIWYKGTAKANNLSVLATHVDDILCFFQDKQGAKDLRKNLDVAANYIQAVLNAQTRLDTSRSRVTSWNGMNRPVTANDEGSVDFWRRSERLIFGMSLLLLWRICAMGE